MNILVTGAAGFIGSNFATHLVKQGHDVYGCYNRNWHHCHSDIRTLEVNLESPEYNSDTYYFSNVDAVCMFAANAGGIGHITSKTYEIMKTNLKIDINTIELCKKYNIKNILFASTACVYSKQVANIGMPLKESDTLPLDPDEGYGWAKLTTEKILEFSGLNAKIARLHTIYGPGTEIGGDKEKVPVALCRKVYEAKDGEAIEIWGDGYQSRTFCHIKDTVVGLEKLLLSNHAGPVNIGHSHQVTIDELADYIIEASGKKLCKKYMYNAPAGVKSRGTDLTLAKEALNWYPEIHPRDGMKELYFWVESKLKNRRVV